MVVMLEWCTGWVDFVCRVGEKKFNYANSNALCCGGDPCHNTGGYKSDDRYDVDTAFTSQSYIHCMKGGTDVCIAPHLLCDLHPNCDDGEDKMSKSIQGKEIDIMELLFFLLPSWESDH